MSKRYWILLAVVVGIAALVGGVVVASHPETSSAASPEAPAWLTEQALAAAAEYGDSTPTSVSWALTDTAAAETVAGGSVTDAEQEAAKSCYVAIVKGEFTNDVVRGGPFGLHSLTGDTIEFIYDPNTHERTDFAFFEGTGAVDTSGIPNLQTFDLSGSDSVE